MQNDSPEYLWNKVKNEVKTRLDSQEYKAWINPIKLDKLDANVVILNVPSRFFKTWVEQNYLVIIKAIYQAMDSNVLDVKIKVAEDTSPKAIDSTDTNVDNSNHSPSPASDNIVEVTISNVVNKNISEWSIENIGSKLDSRMNFDDFVVGKPNEFAYAVAKKIATIAGESSAYNPFFLHSGVGLGKTHLMNAIALHVNETKPNLKLLFLTAERFMHAFIQCLRLKEQNDFKHLFRNVDMLFVDDIQFIAGKDSTQEEFFHTFNALVSQGKQVILSADRSPSDIEGIEQRLTSRMNSGIVVDLHPTTYELRLGILQKKTESLNINLSDDILAYMAKKITSNVRELEGALSLIALHYEFNNSNINLDKAKEILNNIIRNSQKKLDISEIIKVVAEYYNIPIRDIKGSRRVQNITKARQVAMFISKELTDLSLPEIGRAFDGKDHTTVLYAAKKINQALANDTSLSDDIKNIKKQLDIL